MEVSHHISHSILPPRGGLTSLFRRFVGISKVAIISRSSGILHCRRSHRQELLLVQRQRRHSIKILVVLTSLLCYLLLSLTNLNSLYPKVMKEFPFRLLVGLGLCAWYEL